MKFYSIAFLLFIPGFLFAQTPDSSNVSKDTSRNLKVRILPNGYYRPETRIGLGTFMLFTFKGKRADTSARWSYFKTTFMVTQNKQIALENDWQIFIKKEKYITYGALDVVRFPELFFGIGNNTSPDSSELSGLPRISHSSLLLKKINGNIFIGINLNTQYLFGKSKEPLIRYEYVNGSKGYFVNGIGPTFLFDSRDNVLTTYKGWYNEISLTFHHDITLSDYNYVNYVINSRNFMPLFKKTSWAKNWIWANEIYLSFNSGTLPFRSNPMLGGFRFLRGYYTGRFRDKNLIFYQTEIRIPVYWRIGVVAFAGVGQVAPDLKTFSADQMKLTGGGGLRFTLSKRERANIRFDYGFTNEGSGFYLVFGEAF